MKKILTAASGLVLIFASIFAVQAFRGRQSKK